MSGKRFVIAELPADFEQNFELIEIFRRLSVSSVYFTDDVSFGRELLSLRQLQRHHASLHALAPPLRQQVEADSPTKNKVISKASRDVIESTACTACERCFTRLSAACSHAAVHVDPSQHGHRNTCTQCGTERKKTCISSGHQIVDRMKDDVEYMGACLSSFRECFPGLPVPRSTLKQLRKTIAYS